MTPNMPPEVCEETLKRALASAIWSAVDEDQDFRSHHASEVSIVAPVYARLYGKWPRVYYRVDLEYDREGHDGSYKCSDPNMHGHDTNWKRPDILVHRRGQGIDHNLLVIEFKVNQDSANDGDKVRHLMGVCKRYKYGATVTLSRSDDNHRWRWFTRADSQPPLVPIPRFD